MAWCKNFFKILTLIIVCFDISLGWYKFYHLYHETDLIISDLDKSNVNTALKEECDDPNFYLHLYFIFELTGSVLASIEIYYLILEVRTDRLISDHYFKSAWFLTASIYTLAVFPSLILDIVFRERCVCHEGVSFKAWQDESRDLLKGVLDGVSVIFLQILLHLTEASYRLRRTRKFLGAMIFGIDYEYEHKPESSSAKTRWGLAIGIVFVLCYIVLFITEVTFIFCA